MSTAATTAGPGFVQRSMAGPLATAPLGTAAPLTPVTGNPPAARSAHPLPAVQRMAVPGAAPTAALHAPVPAPVPAPSPDVRPDSTGPVRHGTDALPLNGVAEAFPAVRPATTAVGVSGAPTGQLPVQRAVLAPVAAGTATGGVPAAVQTAVHQAVPTSAQAAVSLAPVTSTSAAELPVQRAPATPSLASRMTKFVSPQRTAEARVTPVTVGRDDGGSSGGSRAAKPPADPPPAYSRYDTRRTNPTRGNGGNSGSGGNDAAGGADFDARTLSDGQVDELTHRLIGPLTRLLRTELRLDRERIGRLRDSRR